MKQLTCEMCGSTELVKQDGFFVCQACGIKYSVEEAKKMMIEGTVDVQGTVKLDNSAFVEKYLVNARRAKQKEDWEETEKYYNMVEQNDPTNIEAIFYSSYGKAKSSLVESDIYKRQAAFKVLQNSVSIIDDNFSIEKEEENKKVIEEISNDIFLMACSNYVYNQRKNGYGAVIWTDQAATITLFNDLGREFMVSLEEIAKKFPEEDKQKKVYYYELALKHAEFILKNGRLASPQSFKNVINTYRTWINEIVEQTTEEKRKERIKNYWESHKQEKAALDNETENLKAQTKQCTDEITQLEHQKDSVPALAQLIQVQKNIEQLKAEKKALGLFKGKEKKAVQEKIDVQKADETHLKLQVASQRQEIEQKIASIKANLNSAINRLRDIEIELTMDRDEDDEEDEEEI